jgi:hypothetical protein
MAHTYTEVLASIQWTRDDDGVLRTELSDNGRKIRASVYEMKAVDVERGTYGTGRYGWLVALDRSVLLGGRSLVLAGSIDSGTLASENIARERAECAFASAVEAYV